MTRRRRRWGALRARSTTGQATVELALVLPVVVLLLLMLIQGMLVVRDHVLTVNAAREAAREASVDGGAFRVASAANRVLRGVEVDIVSRGEIGEPVEVRVRYTSETKVPLVGELLPDVDLEATSTMRVER